MTATPLPVRIALLLEYDGGAYAGSQRQANAATVQGALEQAIPRLAGKPARTAFAGRTDAGVHALGQVAAFTTEARHTPEVWQRALNALLPEDISVRAAAEVGLGFDPRRDARSRTYRYRIWNMPVRSPLWRRHAWHVRERLDVEAMARAAAALVGEHDVASFGGVPAAGRGARRRILRSCVHASGTLVIYEIESTAFLPHQVRRTVGALVEVGRGRLATEQFQIWLATPEPHAAGPAAPPHGLSLVAVSYATPLFDAENRDKGLT